MGYSFFDLAIETFRILKRPLSINELWQAAEELELANKLGTFGKTPCQTLAARIYVDLKQNPDTAFIQVSKRPAKFYLKELAVKSIEETEDKPTTKKANTKVAFNERDLHILLSTFVYSNPHFNCYTKTIFHENSKKNKKGYNEWLHPDIVGIYFPFDRFQGETLKLLETFKENAYKLYSFEMKLELNFSNLRKSYFQAVSNSSWAHEGYLVALNIDDDPTFKDELRRLNNAFGIGIIKLDAKNIEQSEIMFTSKINEFLDWETIDRLADENNDFRNFIDDLMEDIKIGKVKSKYDKILLIDEYEDYVRVKGIN